MHRYGERQYSCAVDRFVLAIGAVLGAADLTAKAMGRYGHHLGLAFQAVDDLLGIWGNRAVTGKPRWSDLRRRKKSFPICTALAGDSPPREPSPASTLLPPVLLIGWTSTIWHAARS
ncbi:polyprenyl synthetase family protein [Streptomyces sp. NPDC058701]|uniref:polyprenyl synthetase family protein n=1 Tax=Streptomyces sp. NPDC058701 TaxID=3346608 RepID=UPI0036661623